MPEFEYAGHLVEYLFEFGPVKADGPLEPVDILAIQQVLAVKFKPWESRLLIRLSRAYKAEMYGATKRNAPPPWPEAMPQWRAAQRAAQQLNMERNLDAFLK